MTTEALEIDYYTDVLCVWAYIAQIKVDQIVRDFGPRIRMRYRYLPLFGNNPTRIGEGWKEQGGFAGYGSHVCKVAQPCNYAPVHPDIWNRNAPVSSLAAHLHIKAIEGLERSGWVDAAAGEHEGRTTSQEFAWRVRQAFFRDLRDVGGHAVLEEIIRDQGLPLGRIRDEITSGRAYAELASDIEDREKLRLEGSPTFVLNSGRQKLYGNVGYDVIAANVRTLLERDPELPVWR